MDLFIIIESDSGWGIAAKQEDGTYKQTHYYLDKQEAINACLEFNAEWEEIDEQDET